jgi:hypothetical protein
MTQTFKNPVHLMARRILSASSIWNTPSRICLVAASTLMRKRKRFNPWGARWVLSSTECQNAIQNLLVRALNILGDVPRIFIDAYHLVKKKKKEKFMSSMRKSLAQAVLDQDWIMELSK